MGCVIPPGRLPDQAAPAALAGQRSSNTSDDGPPELVPVDPSSNPDHKGVRPGPRALVTWEFFIFLLEPFDRILVVEEFEGLGNLDLADAASDVDIDPLEIA